MTELKQTETSIITRDRWFDFTDPWSYDYDIEEIAHALSNLCRYTGHVQPFYSVAEHSVLVSRVVPSDFGLEGLLHDASEAFCGDVNKPLKAMLPEYKAIEEEVQAAIAHFYGLIYPFPEAVHKADGEMYWAERETVSKSKLVDVLWNQDNKKKLKVRPVGLSPVTAKREFLDRFKELWSDRHGSVYGQAKAEDAASEQDGGTVVLSTVSTAS